MTQPQHSRPGRWSRLNPLQKAGIILGVPVGLFAILVVIALITGAGEDEEQQADDPAPEYTVITEELPDGGIGRAELLLPDATVETAEAAIRDYADRRLDGLSAATIQVVRGEHDAVIVCRADWPDLDDTMNCPDPAGDGD